MKKRLILAIVAVLGAFGGKATAQTYERITNLPHVYIQTENNRSISSKTTYIYATMYYVDEDDVVTQYDSMEIRGRGNSTWNLSKKPYKIKFHQKEKFLGKGYAKTKKWTLLANAGDKTMMRNAVTTEMGEFLGLKFNPAARFVDVTLNGRYIGTYQISDHVDVRPHRVNITEQDLPLADTSDITGGYLLEVDGFVDGNCFTTRRGGVPVRIHYPDEDDIVAAQNNYISQYLSHFEDVLFGSDFQDPESGYRSWVDSVSLANWYIATEVSGNIDGFYSTYFYKDQNDPKFYWGPLWDYDIAYANDTRKGNTTYQMMTDVGYGQTKQWVNQMWLDPWFARLINRRYEQALEDGLQDFLLNKIDSISDLLAESQELNYEVWGINRRMYHEIVLYSSYEQYVADLKEYVINHIAYLRSAFANKKPAEPTPPFRPSDFYYRITNAGTARALDLYSPTGQYYTTDFMPEAGALVCTWANQEERWSQDWHIVSVGKYFILKNRLGEFALTDPTEGETTATTNLGAQLAVAVADTTDYRQLWTLTPQGTAGYYNLTNLYTQHTANLSGGNSSNGAKVVSYSTDSRNSTSNNRLWYIMQGDELPDSLTNPVLPTFAESEFASYALVYNPVNQTLRFAGEQPAQFTFEARIVAVNGNVVRQFHGNQTCQVAELPRGVYAVSWNEGSHRRSAKFVKR